LAGPPGLLGDGRRRGGRHGRPRHRPRPARRRPAAHPPMTHSAPEGGPMPLVAGVNHVAVLTDDLDRFVEFYTGTFDLEVVFEETTPAFRHAILRAGETSWLHPAEVTGNEH